MEPNNQTDVVDVKQNVVRDVFINIATMLSLGVAIVSFIGLIEGILDTILPDHFNCGCDFTTTIVYHLAMLMVSYGLYVYLSWRMRKTEGVLSLHHSTRFHQVVVYLTLFFSGLALSYELVTILQSAFYFGFTTAVIIKLAILFVVFGGVFVYYFLDIKKSGDVAHSKLAVASWWVMTVLVVGAVVGAFLVIGSPTTQKNMRFDEERISALESIASDISDEVDYTSYQLPEKLSDFYTEEYMNTILDPQFNQPYEYRTTGDSSYELCATFGAASDTEARKLQKVYGPNATNTTDPWAHEKGRQCFPQTVERESSDTESEY